jgi:hypothetical protein
VKKVYENNMIGGIPHLSSTVRYRNVPNNSTNSGEFLFPQKKMEAEMKNETELRIRAGRSVQQWARLLAERLTPDDSWRLMLAGCLAVMLPLLGDKATADTLRELADDIESGREPRTLN